MKKELDCDPIYDKNFESQNEILWSYGWEATHFHDKEMPQVGCNYPCLAVILIDSVLKKDKLLSASVFKRK